MTSASKSGISILLSLDSNASTTTVNLNLFFDRMCPNSLIIVCVESVI